MASTSNSNKRARVDAKYRKGVTWRENADGVLRSWLVEIRLAKDLVDLKLKLHFGTYKSEEEAMIARDYVAFLRNSTGKEKPGAVGGYRQRDDPTAIFEFEESPWIFDRLDSSKARCDEFKRFLELNSKDARDAFVAHAKEDIRSAIELFRSTYSEKFGRGFYVRGRPMADPQATSLLTNEIRGLPTAGCNVGDGSTAKMIEVSITVQGSAPKTMLIMDVSGLSTEEIQSAAIDNLGIDNLCQALTNMMRLKQEVEEMLASKSPCPVDPNDVPPLESFLPATFQLQHYDAENQHGGCCCDTSNPNFPDLGTACLSCVDARLSGLPIL